MTVLQWTSSMLCKVVTAKQWGLIVQYSKTENMRRWGIGLHHFLLFIEDWETGDTIVD